MFFVDDGISGTSFERSDFQRMQRMAEEGKICRIIVKDLSRFGREQVEAGRLTQIVYPSLGITFISIQENVNSTTGDGMKILYDKQRIKNSDYQLSVVEREYRKLTS